MVDSSKGQMDRDLSEKWQSRFASMDAAGLRHPWFRVWALSRSYGEVKAKWQAMSTEEKEAANSYNLPAFWREVVGFNVPAFVFGPYYYFAKKMFYKGAVLLSLGLLVEVVLADTFGPFPDTGDPADIDTAYLEVFSYFFLVMGSSLGLVANYDYYRHVRLEEKIWPFLPSFFGTARGAWGSMAIALLASIGLYDTSPFFTFVDCATSGLWGFWFVLFLCYLLLSLLSWLILLI